MERARPHAARPGLRQVDGRAKYQPDVDHDGDGAIGTPDIVTASLGDRSVRRALPALERCPAVRSTRPTGQAPLTTCAAPQTRQPVRHWFLNNSVRSGSAA